MPELAAAQGPMVAPQAQEFLDIGKDFLLLGRSSLRRESALFVFVPAAGEIVAIVRVISSWHRDFIAVIEFGNAAKGKGRPKASFSLTMDDPGTLAKRGTS